MNLVKHAWLVYCALAVLAISAVVIGEVYKVAWVADWLAPILMLIFFVSISTLSHRPDASASTRSGRVASYAKVTAFAVLIYLFIMIEIVSDAPVTLRLMGMSMSMSGQAASRFLVIAGLVIGAFGAWVNLSQVRREAAAAALAKAASGQVSPTPASAPNP
jgi:hypothetical protein